MLRLEFWPDYGAGPLGGDDGKPADLGALGLPNDLVSRLADWNRRYEEDPLPADGAGDSRVPGSGSPTASGVPRGAARHGSCTGFRAMVDEPPEPE